MNNKLKIFHISAIDARKISGPRNSVRELASSGFRLNQNVYILTTKKSFDWFSEKHPKGSVLSLFSYVFNFKRLLTDRSDSIYVFHSTFIFSHVATMLIFSLLGVKYVIYPRGGLTFGALGVKGRKKEVALLFGVGYLFKKSSAVIYLNHDECINSRSMTDRHIIVPNGIKLQRALTSNMRSYNDPSLVRLGFLGRYSIFHKGLDLALQWFSKIDQKGSCNFQLLLHGEGDDVSDLSHLVGSLGLSSSVDIFGPLESERKSAFFSEIDIFFHFSRFEGQPQSVLESLFFGVPVLVSNGTNLAGDIGTFNLGWVVNSASDLERALSSFSLMSPLEISSMSRRCIEYTDTYCNWDESAQMLDDSLRLL